MSHDPPSVGLAGAKRPRWAGRGFTLVEVVVASVLLDIVLIFVLGGLLYGIKEGTKTRARAGAVAWMDGEASFLRAQGYAGLADDVTAGTRTLTQTTGYTTYGGLSEPRIPVGFNRAEVVVTNVSGLSLRQFTLRLYETAASTSPYATLSSRVANGGTP